MSSRRWRRRRRATITSLRQRTEHRRRRLPEPVGPDAPIVEVRGASATSDSSDRTGARIVFRVVMAAVLVLALFSTLLVRLWSLQVIHGASARSSTELTVTRQLLVPPARGEIEARGGQVLAGNVASEQVALDPAEANAHPTVEAALASLLGVQVRDIVVAIDHSAVQYGPYAPVIVPTGAGGVTKADVVYIEQNPSTFPGVSIQPGYTRTYPYGALASQLVGYLSEPESGTIVGGSGLEASYESALHGTPGSQTIVVNNVGAFVSTETRKAAVPGDNVVLNLDFGLEKTATDALTAQIAALRSGSIAGTSDPAPYGAAVVMDNHGHVLAWVSYPGYNANDFVLPISDTTYQSLLHAYGSPTLDYPIQALQPPGSTFKLITATAALNDSIISAGTYINDSGLFRYGNQTYTDSEGESLGEVNITTAISESSDYYFYTLGADFWARSQTKTPIQDTAAAYGLTTASGIDLPVGNSAEEALGQIDSPGLRILQHREAPAAFPNNTYQGGDNVDLAIGQGETVVTPLAMADAYQAFVNHGVRYAPELAREIVGPSGKVIRTIAPKVEDRISIPPSTWEPMDQGFIGAVQAPKGTAYGAFTGFDFNSWTLAGKTGTADVTNNSSKAPTAWFIGFGGPVKSSTRYIVAVMINQGGFGAQASAPVARKIFDYLYHHGVAPVTGH